MAKSKKRIIAEGEIINLMQLLDPSGYNAEKYIEYFKTLNETQFKDYMEQIAYSDDTNLFFEIESYNKDSYPTIDKLEKISKKIGVPLTEHVIFPHKNPKNPPVSATKATILMIPTKRLQQILDKKNSASADIDVINPMTGQTTGKSKGSSLTDMQVFSLTTVGLKRCLKEFLAPRSDDFPAKEKMLEQIERYGEVSLGDLNIQTKNKQSIQTMKVFMKGAGFDVEM